MPFLLTLPFIQCHQTRGLAALGGVWKLVWSSFWVSDTKGSRQRRVSSLQNFIEPSFMFPKSKVTEAQNEESLDFDAYPCLTFAEIAALAGFESAFYFSRIFKKKTEQAPSEYRRKT